MRTKLFTFMVVASALCLTAAKFNATQVQVALVDALVELKFKDEGAKLPGGPHTLVVTKDTLKHLDELLKAGKSITVNAEGKLSVVK